jgi:hypothetical protein
MYKCSVCGKAVIVEGVTTPIRACNCKKADGTPSTIVVDMDATAKGRSQFKQK